MESLVGCPNEALLALAEVSALSHWKTQEKCTECLSVRMLAHRGNRIEERLRQHSSTQAGMTEFGLVPPRPPRLLTIPLTQIPVSSNAGAADLSLHVESFPDEDTRQTVAQIFREAAVLYLHTVLSDPYPGMFLS
jgi:C6 transcription factor Pro1